MVHFSLACRVQSCSFTSLLFLRCRDGGLLPASVSTTWFVAVVNSKWTALTVYSPFLILLTTQSDLQYFTHSPIHSRIHALMQRPGGTRDRTTDLLISVRLYPLRKQAGRTQKQQQKHVQQSVMQLLICLSMYLFVCAAFAMLNLFLSLAAVMFRTKFGQSGVCFKEYWFHVIYFFFFLH